MRVLGVLIVAAAIAAGTAMRPLAAPEAGAHSAAAAAAAQQPSGQLEVDINTDEGGAWWANPVWVAIGAIALVLLVIIVALIARSDRTTIIKN